MSPVNPGISTILQTSVDNQILGRVSSALHAVIQTSNLLSMFLAGVSSIIVVIAGLAALQIFRGYGVGETAVTPTMQKAETAL